MARRQRGGVKRKRGVRRGRAVGRRLATVSTVKRLISRTQETKNVGLGLSDLTLGARRFYVFSPMYSIPKGTGANQRIGESVRNVRIRGSFTWQWVGTGMTGTQLSLGMPLRVMVVRTPRDIGLGQSGWQQVSALSTDTGSSALPFIMNPVQTSTSFADPNSDVKIVKQFWIDAPKNVSGDVLGAAAFKNFSFSVPKYDYEVVGGAPGQGRHYNYYIVVTCGGNMVLGDNANTGSMQSNFLITYKDA